jgi:S1-C subfamily serine protease
MASSIHLVSAVCLGSLVAAGPLLAQRAPSPADATVYVRVIGNAHVEIDEAGGRRVANLEQVEIGTGSGFIVSPSGYVLTNQHVVDGGKVVETRGDAKILITTQVSRIEVCFSPEAAKGQGTTLPCADASVYAADADRDLAVLFVSAPSLPYIALGDSDAVSRGQAVQALGYPLGRQVEVGRSEVAQSAVPELSAADGTISALREGDAGQRRYLQISSSLNPGNSGGPVVDSAGFAVGVIRMTLRGASGIGFAIPINDVKDFLETRGLDQLMPTRRLRLGPFESVPDKSLGLRLPTGLQDIAEARTLFETDPRASDVTLRVTRVFTPWTSRQVEQSLVTAQQFEPFATADSRSETMAVGGVSRVIGRATGTAVNADLPLRMDYAVVDLGPEVLVARYVGSEEALAFNASVTRASLASLEGQGLMALTLPAVPGLAWTSLPIGDTGDSVPVPAAWPLEGGAPVPCDGLPEPRATAVVVAPRDFTVTLRLAEWANGPDAAAAAAACSSRRAALGAASYATTVDSMGVGYAVEGVFVKTRAGSLLQAEMAAPTAKAVFARALLAAWAARAGESASR